MLTRAVTAVTGHRPTNNTVITNQLCLVSSSQADEGTDKTKQREGNKYMSLYKSPETKLLSSLEWCKLRVFTYVWISIEGGQFKA